MGYTNGLDKEAFLQYMFQEFPSVFNNSFAREMLENIVDYGTADNFTHTKNELYYFLKDMIPEVEPRDLIPFMDKAMLTNEVLSLVGDAEAYRGPHIVFKLGFGGWCVSIDGVRFCSMQVNPKTFEGMNLDDLEGFVDENLRDIERIEKTLGVKMLTDEDTKELKGLMFDSWRVHFGIADKNVDDLIADAAASVNVEKHAEKVIEREKEYE